MRTSGVRGARGGGGQADWDAELYSPRLVEDPSSVVRQGMKTGQSIHVTS